jgi:hypothetical protein
MIAHQRSFPRLQNASPRLELNLRGCKKRASFENQEASGWTESLGSITHPHRERSKEHEEKRIVKQAKGAIL